MSKTRKYFSVIARGKRGQAAIDAPKWSPQFGDYDREVANDEMRDMKGDYGWTGYEFKVITTGSSQKEIMAAIDALNVEHAVA